MEKIPCLNIAWKETDLEKLLIEIINQIASIPASKLTNFVQYKYISLVAMDLILVANALDNKELERVKEIVKWNK